MPTPPNPPSQLPYCAIDDLAGIEAVRADNNALRAENAELKSHLSALEQRIAWFEKQLFGRKSEQREVQNPQQLPLVGLLSEAPRAAPPEPPQTVTYERGRAPKARTDDCVTDSGLRFGSGVPVQVIELAAPELQGPDADRYEQIGTEVTHRLAQRPSSYMILEYRRPVFKAKADGRVLSVPAPENVLERSQADVSVLAGLLVDKFVYHLPLYRQHQRLQQSEITLSRATLTAWVKRAIELVKPIAYAQLAHMLAGHVLAMDETPIKAGRKAKPQAGKAPKATAGMKQGYFWPLYGEDDEVVFTYSESRGRQHIESVLKKDFEGVLLTDGYAVYDRFANANQAIIRAQCWVHARRLFVEAEGHDAHAVAQALEMIAALYRYEDQASERKLEGEKLRAYRLEHHKGVTGAFFEWCEDQLRRGDLEPKHPLLKAVNYALTRRTELCVFLEDPEVPLDTNHLERALRPIPMGRKNWMFCWTEIGAEHVGIIQSLMVTCRLHGVDPYVYLVDVMQRVGQHPANKVIELTPRIWKELFADNPLRSDLARQ